MIITILFIFVVMVTDGESTVINMYQKDRAVYNNWAYGKMCLMNDRTHIPTCGWRLAIRSTTAFTSLETFECENSRVSDTFYTCTNKIYNQDLTNPPSSCFNINIQGDFWNVDPVVTVTWYCVCTAGTDGDCSVVEQSTPSDDQEEEDDTKLTQPATTITTIPPQWTTTTTPTTASTAAISVAVAAGGYEGNHISDATQTLMQLQEDDVHTGVFLCYTGSDVITMHGVGFLGRCVSYCIPMQECAGVNYWEGTKRCDLIQEADVSVSQQLDPITGCRYFKVIYKL